MWTLRTALAFVRELEAAGAPRGWHFALAGGVMKTGRSSHDLDVIAFPHTVCESRYPILVDTLKVHGCERVRTATQLRHHTRSKGSKDTKHVEVWMLGDKRVDVIVPSMKVRP